MKLAEIMSGLSASCVYLKGSFDTMHTIDDCNKLISLFPIFARVHYIIIAGAGAGIITS